MDLATLWAPSGNNGVSTKKGKMFLESGMKGIKKWR